VQASSIRVAGRAFTAPDAVLQLIYPSPANAGRYTLVVAPTSAAGMYFWNAGGLWRRPFGVSLVPLDWTIQDGLRVNPPRGVAAERTFVASGVFDTHWRLRDEYVFPGDTAIRAGGALRAAPTPDTNAAGLGDYAGDYQLVPGFAASIRPDGARLVLSIPSSPPLTLVPERKDEFGALEASTNCVFVRDAGGKITGLNIFSDAPMVFAPRLGSGGPSTPAK